MFFLLVEMGTRKNAWAADALVKKKEFLNKWQLRNKWKRPTKTEREPVRKRKKWEIEKKMMNPWKYETKSSGKVSGQESKKQGKRVGFWDEDLCFLGGKGEGCGLNRSQPTGGQQPDGLTRTESELWDWNVLSWGGKQVELDRIKTGGGGVKGGTASAPYGGQPRKRVVFWAKKNGKEVPGSEKGLKARKF